MALSNIQALGVVIDCVDGVSGRTPAPDDTLKDGGIVDDARLQAWKSLVAADEQLGVRRHLHRIEPDVLDGVATGDGVQDAADLVRAKAVPMTARETGVVIVLEDEKNRLCSMVTGATPGAASKKAARPAGTPSRKATPPRVSSKRTVPAPAQRGTRTTATDGRQKAQPGTRGASRRPGARTRGRARGKKR
jgi:hypothetical protein